MSLERKDFRGKLDPDLHAALKVFADMDGITDGEYVESILAAHLRQRVHDITVAAAKLQLSGTTGNLGERPGAAGNRGAR